MSDVCFVFASATEKDPQKTRLELLERNKLDQEKKDMWDD